MADLDIARLRALLAAARLSGVRWTGDYPGQNGEDGWALVDDEKFPRPYGVLWCDRSNAPDETHRDLLASSVNALPDLLSLAEEALERREGLLVFRPAYPSSPTAGNLLWATSSLGGLWYEIWLHGDKWRGTFIGDHETIEQAIEAARAHDRARRAKETT